jgi:BolA protein
MNDRVARIREILTREFAPTALDIEDQGHLHIGHAGARDGRGHFRVRIVSPAFAGQSPVVRHRAVYGALAEMLKTDIHALAVEARTPDETR